MMGSEDFALRLLINKWSSGENGFGISGIVIPKLFASSYNAYITGLRQWKLVYKLLFLLKKLKDHGRPDNEGNQQGQHDRRGAKILSPLGEIMVLKRDPVDGCLHTGVEQFNC